MQTEYRDGSKGPVVTAKRVEELLPKIKEALANPNVKCVRIFNNGSDVQAESEIKTQAEQVEELLEIDEQGDVVKKKKQAVAETIPGRK